MKMKKILFLLFVVLSIFVSCNDETPVLPNETIDKAFLGAWQVDFSQTILGVRMRPNGTLEPLGEQTDTTTFFGQPQMPITSFMFWREENIIDIRNDNWIKIYHINARGGVTISREQVSYFVRNDTLFRQTANMARPHLYHLENDTLIIRRIPVEQEWAYTISRYFKTNL